MSGEPLRLGAVVLAGGTAARMGGVDKAVIEIDGVTLLERSLAATMSALEVVVVGEPVPTSRPVTFTREDPAGGGPAAGLLAGIDRFLRVPDLVAVVGDPMFDVSPDEAWRRIGGFTVGNDLGLHDFRDVDNGSMLRV